MQHTSKGLPEFQLKCWHVHQRTEQNTYVRILDTLKSRYNPRKAEAPRVDKSRGTIASSLCGRGYATQAKLEDISVARLGQ